MQADLRHEVLARLSEFKFNEKVQGNFLREGICPSCKKKELYINAEAPWVAICGRLNNCGERFHVKELYPDLFDSWSNRYKSTPEKPNPNAAADAYLQQGRGFSLAKVQGMYTQEYYFDQELKQGSATVRFPFADGWWERLIDKPHRFSKKANFKFGTSYKGKWWKPDYLVINQVQELWIVEGIFDAIALSHHDIAAVSVMSCNNYPEESLRNFELARGNKDCLLVWALDSDKAGTSFTKKHIEKAESAGWRCAAAQIPVKDDKKLDWNDAHLLDKLNPADIDEYRYQGDLLTAKSATAKALLIYEHDEQSEFFFNYQSRLYWFSLNLDEYNKQRQAQEDDEENKLVSEQTLREKALAASSSIRQIANCYPQALYFQENLITNESWYYYRVTFPHDEAPVKNTFTASQLASAAEFKKRLLSIAGGAIYTGSSSQLDRLLSAQLYNIKRVETVDFIGYSIDHSCYVLGDIAVNDGKIIKINQDDFFSFGKTSLKSLNKSVSLSINTERDDYRTDWPQLIYQAFGVKGLAALTFWFGSLFAEQIRAVQSSYPFLEVVGEAGAGKSTLIEFLWKLFGRSAYEGFDPSKSSLAARARNFSQVSGLPVVLIESDRERLGEERSHVKSFDWDELKTAYNGRSTRARGMATGGNETYEPPFRGSIVISQNNAVNASEAILSRIVHLYFDRSTQTAESGAAADQLKYIPTEQVSGFVLAATKREKAIMELVRERTPIYLKQLRANPAVRMPRIAETHAQMLALTDALAMVIKLPETQHQALHAQFVQMACERQLVINNDHVLVQEFWEAFDYLETLVDNQGPIRLNHSANADEIAVNLNEFLEVAITHRQQVPLLRDVKKVLATSRRRRFVASNKTITSTITKKSIRCWVFKTDQ